MTLLLFKVLSMKCNQFSNLFSNSSTASLGVENVNLSICFYVRLPNQDYIADKSTFSVLTKSLRVENDPFLTVGLSYFFEDFC